MRTAALCLGSERMCPQVRTTRRPHGAIAQFVSAYNFGRLLVKPVRLGDSALGGPVGRVGNHAAAAAASAASNAAVSGAAAQAADGVEHLSGSNGRSASSSSGQPFMGAEYFPAGEFSIDFQVRDYELDQFGVVNNAVYSSYFQHARHEAFAVLGHEVDDFARKGNPLALSSMAIAFRAPLRTRDRFRVTVSVAKVSGARCVMHQRILRRLTAGELQEAQQQQAAGTASGGATSPAAEQLVAEADATVVFLDAAYRPARMPRDIFKVFSALHNMQAAAEAARTAQAEAGTPGSGPAAAAAATATGP